MTPPAFTWRALTLADTPAWSALTKAIADAEGSDEYYLPEDLAEELEDPGSDPARDTVAVVAEDGTLVAFGQVLQPVQRADGAIRAGFEGGVHPAHRGRGIGTALLARLEDRALVRGGEAFPGRPVLPQTGSASGDSARLFEACGYQAVRYFHVMAHDLAASAPADDSRLQDYDATLDDEVRAAHIDAFGHHWNFAAPDAQRWRHWFTGSRTFRPACSTIAPGPAGQILGYLLAYEYLPGELVFGQIGVRTAARGQGLGRAMLRRALVRAAQAGYTAVKLDVDSGNADGAGRLYESAGFVRLRTTTVYEHDSGAVKISGVR